MCGMSIGWVPYSQKYFPATLLVRLRSAPGADLRLSRMNGRLTASPAAVYRCDLIERRASFSYSVIHARGMYRRANFPVPEKGDPTWRLVRFLRQKQTSSPRPA